MAASQVHGKIIREKHDRDTTNEVKLETEIPPHTQHRKKGMYGNFYINSYIILVYPFFFDQKETDDVTGNTKYIHTGHQGNLQAGEHEKQACMYQKKDCIYDIQITLCCFIALGIHFSLSPFPCEF